MDIFWHYGGYVLTPLHILVCLILIAVVLLQHGKGTDWAGVFGGGGTQTAFGPRGVENTLSRLTKIAAVVFMVTSFSLSLIQSRASKTGGGLPSGLPAEGKPKPAASPRTTPGSGGAEAAPSLPGLPAAPVVPAASPAASPTP